MLYRYRLVVTHQDLDVFDGNFSSLNKMVKVACSFNKDHCSFEAFDELFGKTIAINLLIDEFVTSCTGI